MSTGGPLCTARPGRRHGNSVPFVIMEVAAMKGADGQGIVPAGILRLDVGTGRRTSADLKFLQQIEPASPQPSVDRLSVTFAEESCVSAKQMDKVHFSSHTDEENSEEDEEYSASVMAIMQRSASTRRSKRRGRRTSSPFSPDILPNNNNQSGRRSSVFTTSSGDTGITVEDNFNTAVTQDQILENIRLHKEVLSSVKMQPWHMRKKLRLILQAKSYIERHEGALQERLAQSHSTKDILARWNIYLIKKWQYYRREAANMSNWLIPWELRIKEIESHFGSVVASYFLFLRWMIWVNLVISIVLIAFVAIPEMLAASLKTDHERKSILAPDKYNSTNFLTLWDFEGVLKYSPIFYGWYSDDDETATGYRSALAYFFTGLAVYVYSFVATLTKMAENSRMSKLSEKEDECIFSWKLFTGWDYMIGNAETAQNRVASIIMGFKEALVEEAEKKREAKNWKIIGGRVLVNITVIGLLALSAYAVITVVERSTEKEANSTVWRKNEITVVMCLISSLFPIVFEIIGYCEYYHPRKQLRLQLARIMLLNLLNLYSLIFALLGKIDIMTHQMQQFNKNVTCTPPATAYLDQYQPEVSMPTQQITELGVVECINVCTTDGLVAANLIAITLSSVNFTSSEEYYLKNSSELTENVALANISTEFYIDVNATDFNVSITELYPDVNTTNINIYVNSTMNNNVVISTEVNQEESTDFLESYLNNFTEDKSDEIDQFSDTTTIDTIYTHSNELFSTVETIKGKCKLQCSGEISLNCSGNDAISYVNETLKRSLCWETMFGQELVKLTIMDLMLTVLSTIAIDFLRGVFVRYMNNCWCWDLEKNFPQYGDFKVAENILHLVNNQGMVWMGMFFSPGLVVINLFKLYLMMYLRSWAVLTCNVPHEIIFRASRSNNFYYALLLMMLFLCVLPVGYTIVWLKPSSHCGPFSDYSKILEVFTKTMKRVLPKKTHIVLDYIASPGIVIPLLLLLVLIIYYLTSLTGALRESNNDLKIQLRRERTEERRKMFKIAQRRRRRGGSEGSGEMNAPFNKWKKLLQSMPNRSFEDSARQESMDAAPEDISRNNSFKGEKGIFTKFITKALRSPKPTSVSEDEATDTDQHESLPDDAVSVKEIRPHKKLSESIGKGSNDSAGEVRHVRIKNEQFTYQRRDTFELKRQQNLPLSREDSLNIPTITISKTESAECIL